MKINLWAIALCRMCKREIVIDKPITYCPGCGFNAHWIDEASEELTGRKFKSSLSSDVFREKFKNQSHYENFESEPE